MKCCSAQTSACWEDPESTLAKAIPRIREAADIGASLIAFPEQFATGWDPRSHLHTGEISGTIVSRLTTFAREYGIAVIGSFREAASPLPKNTAVVIGSNGNILARYSKVHLFSYDGEDQFYSPGEETAVFTLGNMRIGVAICYDLRFPELFRIYADQGVHGVIVPSAWPKSRLRHWELFIRARAAENQIYVIGVNTTGTNPVGTYAGNSMTAGPDGSILARAGDGETLLCSDLDATVVEEARHAFPVHKDRRPDFYTRPHSGSFRSL